MTETMELAVVDAKNAIQIFTGGGLNAVLDGIEAKVRAISLDPSTATGREEIRSVAYKVVRTKTALDAEGKKLTEGWRDATKKVNEERKKSSERLDALAEEIRKPLTDFETKEAKRVAGHESALGEITGIHSLVAADPAMIVEELDRALTDIARLHPDRDWEEFSSRASSAKKDAAQYILERIDARKKQDAEAAELARLRKEEAERIQREYDERLRVEAAEKQRIESERKAAAEAEAERKRVAAEAERARLESERVQRDAELARMREENAKIEALKRATDAESARIASEKKAEAERLAAEVRAAGELKAAQEKAKRDADAAVQRERDKIAAERRAQVAAEAKRAADREHKEIIRTEIIDDLCSYGLFDPDFPDRLRAAVEAIMDGEIRHVRVTF